MYALTVLFFTVLFLAIPFALSYVPSRVWETLVLGTFLLVAVVSIFALCVMGAIEVTNWLWGVV